MPSAQQRDSQNIPETAHQPATVAKTHQPGAAEKGVEEFILLCRERDASCNSICRQLHAEFSQRLLQVFSLHGALDPKCVNRVEDRRAISPTLN